MNEHEQPFPLFAAKVILLAGAAWLVFAFLTWIAMEVWHFFNQ